VAYGGLAQSFDCVLVQAGAIILEFQLHTPEMHAVSTSIERDLDSYLDAVASATAVFRLAVDTYLQSGADLASWQQKKRITQRMRKLDDIQQKLVAAVWPGTALGELVLAKVDLPVGISHLVKDMRRQITGFAVGTGFSSPGRRVSSPLVLDLQRLTEEVSAAVDALVERIFCSND
jgi:hypothetical protein